MKFLNLFILIITAFLLFMNCTTDKNLVSSELNQYIGTWRWINTTGGLFPRVIVPEDGENVIIQFDSKNAFRLFRSDTLKVSAQYSLEKAEHTFDKISYSNTVTYGYNFNRSAEYVHAHGDTLDVWDGMIDGYLSLYVKE